MSSTLNVSGVTFSLQNVAEHLSLHNYQTVTVVMRTVIQVIAACDNVICKCEKVTEAEVVAACHRALPIDSTQAIRKRTRAGMGNCQGKGTDSHLTYPLFFSCRE